MSRAKRSSKTRVVGYRLDGPFDETAMERLLEAARERGVVTQYDTGRGTFCWFNGRPGKELRAVRRAALVLVGR